MFTFQSLQGQCHNFEILIYEICCHFWHFMKCNMVWDCFWVYCVTFETYFTVDCTQLILKNKHQIFNFLDDVLIKLLWDMYKRMYATFLEWYPIICAWVSTEIRQLTTILKFLPKISFLYIVCEPLSYDSCSWICAWKRLSLGYFVWDFTLDWAHVIRKCLFLQGGQTDFLDPTWWRW